MMAMTKTAAMAALKKRRAHPPKQIDNSRLYAGSPMYFYCVSCGHLADEKPESYLTPPKKLCADCQHMKDMGVVVSFR